MANILEYKGYQTRVEFDAESLVLCGRIEGIRDLVNYEADSAETVEKAFHEAVDDYLQFCKEVNKDPDKVYGGAFNVRIPPELHRKLAMRAHRDGSTLNKTVQIAIEQFVDEKQERFASPIVVIDASNARGKSIFDGKANTVIQIGDYGVWGFDWNRGYA